MNYSTENNDARVGYNKNKSKAYGTKISEDKKISEENKRPELLNKKGFDMDTSVLVSGVHQHSMGAQGESFGSTGTEKKRPALGDAATLEGERASKSQRNDEILTGVQHDEETEDDVSPLQQVEMWLALDEKNFGDSKATSTELAPGVGNVVANTDVSTTTIAALDLTLSTDDELEGGGDVLTKNTLKDTLKGKRTKEKSKESVVEGDLSKALHGTSKATLNDKGGDELLGRHNSSANMSFKGTKEPSMGRISRPPRQEITKLKCFSPVETEPCKVIVGDRVAWDFGDGAVYFGSVDKCLVSNKGPAWNIKFDDGEVYQFNPEEMKESLKLYRACQRYEASDPDITSKAQEMQRRFETEKTKVLSQLPNDMKSQFLTIGFAKSEDEHWPVLFLSPYHVSEGPARTEWMKEFHKCEELWEVPRLVYWYGSDSLETSFGVVSASDWLTYNDGCALKGLRDMPQKIQTILGQGKILRNEALISKHRAWEHMKQDLKKDLTERIRFTKQREAYELVLDGQELLMEIEAYDRLMKVSLIQENRDRSRISQPTEGKRSIENFGLSI